MKDDIIAVGLDVSKETISVGIAPCDAREAVHYFGTIDHRPAALSLLCKKLLRGGSHLYFCYEAGPFGYALYRRLRAWGHGCDVVAPSLIPKRPGERVKTDRRDALSLASLLRARQLTAVWVRDATYESVRTLVRLRVLAAGEVARSKQQILSFCLIHDRVYRLGRRHWTKTHRNWLADQRFEHDALAFTYGELLGRLERAEQTLSRTRLELKERLADWALYPLVEALQALRGFELETASTRQRGYRSATHSDSEPQPQPRSRTRIPSVTSARSQVRASMASSAASRSRMPSDHRPQLYLRRGPRTCSKKIGATS